MKKLFLVSVEVSFLQPVWAETVQKAEDIVRQACDRASYVEDMIDDSYTFGAWAVESIEKVPQYILDEYPLVNPEEELERSCRSILEECMEIKRKKEAFEEQDKKQLKLEL